MGIAIQGKIVFLTNVPYWLLEYDIVKNVERVLYFLLKFTKEVLQWKLSVIW